jgi:hypothetical protein
VIRHFQERMPRLEHAAGLRVRPVYKRGAKRADRITPPAAPCSTPRKEKAPSGRAGLRKEIELRMGLAHTPTLIPLAGPALGGLR